MLEDETWRNPSLRVVFLKRRKEGKLKNRYPWIFKDEISEVVGEGEDGEVANVFSKDGEFLGRGFHTFESRIAVRMLTSRDEEIDEKFIERRIQRALSRRKGLEGSFRVVHAEGDFLPGLVVDKYNDGLVVQFRTRGMEKLKDLVVGSLVEIFSPSFVYERSDFETHSDESLERRRGILFGREPGEMVISEHGIEYFVDVTSGQKTGFFFDQRANRLRVRNLEGKKALDLYTYTGGFALNLSAAGFEVIGVDKSEEDVEIARKNAERNGLSVSFVVSDVMDFLEGDGGIYDVVIADPPSLIKRKAERGKAVEILSRLTSLVSRRLRIGGTFVLCSCAYNIDAQLLIESMRKGVEGKGLIWRVFDVTYQDIDHPYIAQIPETLYLKCVWAHLEEGW